MCVGAGECVWVGTGECVWVGTGECVCAGTGECVCTHSHMICFDPFQSFEEVLVSVEEDTDIPMTFGPPRHCFSTDSQHSLHMYKLS